MNSRRIEEFENFEMEPSAEVWKRIEEAIPPLKKKRRFLFWLFPLILIITGTFLLSNKSVKYFNGNNYVKNRSDLISSDKRDNNFHTRTSVASYGRMISNRAGNSLNNEKSIHTSSVIYKNINAVKTNNKSSIAVDTTLNNYYEEKAYKQETELTSLKELEYYPSAFEKENKLIERQFSDAAIHSLSRWSVFTTIGASTSESAKSIQTTNETGGNDVRNVPELFLIAGVKYDVSSRIKLSTGISLIAFGQQSNDSIEIYNDGNAGDPGNTYSFNTPLESVSGLASEFNNVFFGSPDSSLYKSNTVGPVTNSPAVKKVYVNLKQELKYIEMPFTILYKFRENKLTPYAGLLFSAGYLMKSEIYLNGERLHYQYKNKPSDFIFSAGITAGFDVSVNRRLYFSVNGFFKKAYTAVFSSGESWKPFSAGIGGGIGYRLNKK
jgi:hypothetical protein